MLAVRIPEPGRWELVEIPTPAPGPGEVLVRVAACGVCGTDVHIFHGGFRADYPVTPGHEFSGELAAVGAGVEQLAVGDRVVLDPNIACGVCAHCRHGRVHCCERLSALGVNRPGGFAEYCLAPAGQVYRVPDGLGLVEAALTEPLACCLHGIDRAAIVPGERVAVLGAGPIGLLMVQLARLAGASQVIAVEPAAPRRALAASLGADLAIDPTTEDPVAAIRDTTQFGADVVIECAGRPETVRTALAAARRGGRVLLFGVCPRDAHVAVSPYELFLHELTLLGSYLNPFTHARALDLLASGRVQADPLLTHRLPLREFARAMALAGQAEAVKIVVAP